MFIKEFEFEIEFKSESLKATCQITHYFKYPLFRVVTKGQRREANSFLYKIAENEFYSFPVYDDGYRKSLLVAITDKLKTLKEAKI